MHILMRLICLSFIDNLSMPLCQMDILIGIYVLLKCEMDKLRYSPYVKWNLYCPLHSSLLIQEGYDLH